MPLLGSAVSKHDDTAIFREVRGKDGNLVLGVDTETLRLLEIDLRNGLAAIRGRGLEIGGLLTGRMPVLDHLPVTWTGCIPVQIEYKFGPAFRPSPADHLTFRNALSQHGGAPHSQVIGYFRSELSDGISIRDDDQSLLRDLFGDQSYCVVLVRPESLERSIVHFYRRAREAGPHFVIGFPLAASRPVAGAPPAVDTQLQAPREAESICWMVVPREPTGLSRGKLRLSIGLGALLVCLALAYFAGTRSRPEPPHESRVAALPPAAQRVVQAPPIAGPSNPTTRPSLATPGAAALPRVTRAPNARKADVPPPPQPPPQLPAANLQTQDPKPEVKPEVAPPVASSAAAGHPDVTPLPDATLVPPGVTKTLPAPENTAPPLPERPKAETLAPVPPPVSPPAQIAPPDPTSKAGFVAPQVVHQVTPAVPLGVASRIRSDVQIDVMVTVDVQGKVTGARVTSRKGAAAGLLSNEALKAAQLFRFRPAQENNRNVQSDMLLTFRFAPSAP
jgi:hypothetical protein